MDGAGQRQSETMKHRFVCACALSLVACGGSALDVGSNSGGSSGSTAEGGSDSGGNGSALGGTVAVGGHAAGAPAETGGEAAMGARAATGGKPSTGTPATGGQMPVGTGGGPSTPGGTLNPLVPQTCGQMLMPGIWEGSTLDFFFNPLDDRWRIELNGCLLYTSPSPRD